MRDRLMRVPHPPANLLVLLPCLFALVHCAEGLGPDPEDYPPVIDEVQDLAGAPVTGAAVGETVFVVGRNFAPAARVFFGGTEAPVLSVSGDGTRIETTVPVVEAPQTVSLYVLVEERKSNAVSFEITHAFSYLVGASPVSLVLNDLDGDRDRDLLVLSHTPCTDTRDIPDCLALELAAYVGRGDGTFRKVVPAGMPRTPCLEQGVAAGDLDHDGFTDLVAAVVAGWDTLGVAVLPGRGDGTFGEGAFLAAEGHYLSALILGDLDRDGNLDVIMSNLGWGRVAAFPGKGDGTFGDARFLETGMSPLRLALDDLNLDGAPDLLAAGDGPCQGQEPAPAGGGGCLCVFPGNGDGTFGAPLPVDPGEGFPPAGPWGGPLLTADLDLDGTPDLVLNGVVLPGNGDGTFGCAVPYDTGGAAGLPAVGVGDINGDGVPDLAVAERAGDTVSVLLGRGDGTFDGGAEEDDRTFFTGRAPSGIVVGDLDGDGDGDLAVANEGSDTLAILPGNGDGSFGNTVETETARTLGDLAAPDMDGDGLADLAVAAADLGPRGGVSVMAGGGDGSFAETSFCRTGAEPTGVSASDLDGDGDPDLAVAFAGNAPLYAGGVSVLLNQGNGALGPAANHPAGWTPAAVAAGDLDCDGAADLTVIYNSRYFGDPEHVAGIAVLRGRGDGTFLPAALMETEGAHSSLALGDLDGDGNTDLVLTPRFDWGIPPRDPARSRSVIVRLGNGDGTFEGPVFYLTPGHHCRFVTVRDLNRDGAPDLVVADSGPSASVDPAAPTGTGRGWVFLNLGDGTFGEAEPLEAAGAFTWVGAGDLDRDGHPDLALVNETANGVSVLRGNGDGTFGEAVNYLTGPRPARAAMGDFDGDGEQDLAVIDRKSGTVSVLFAGN